MFKKIKRPSTYSRKEKARPNLAFQNYHACEEAFDFLKKDIKQINKIQLDESQKPKFFSQNWRAHNDTSDFNSNNKSEDSNPMFKDLDDVYQMSFISSKELKKTVKNKKRDINVRKIKKKRKKKIINLVERFNKRSPSTEKQIKRPPSTEKQIFCFSTPLREEKATFPKVNFSPISGSVNTNQSIQPSRLSDVLLKFDNLKLETPLKDSTVSVDTGSIVLEPGKKWRRSLLKLKQAETCENRGLRQGRKSCTSALIATLATINTISTEFGPEESFSNSSAIPSQIVQKKLFSNENEIHSRLKRDSKFCFSNPFMKRNVVWQKPPQLFGIKEILTPHKHQSSNDHKTDEVHQKSTSSIINLVDIENKLNINEKEEIIDADLRIKTHYNKSILSNPPPNELISHSVHSNSPKLSLKNQITMKRKTYYEPDTSKDQSIHFPSRNALISNSGWSKLKLSNRITTKRKTYGKPDAVKDQSPYFSTPNELISDGGDNDKSKLRFNNRITSRRKTYDKPDISKDQNVHFPPPNELISDSEDSDRSICRSSSQITDIKKISYDKPDTSKDQSVDFPSRNSLISYNDRSKVRLTYRITTKRKIYDKPDTLKNHSLQFSHPNELIFGRDDSDRSVLRLNNRVTSRRNTYYKPNISKDQSVDFPSSNELISDSDGRDRYIFSGSNRITAIKKNSYDNLDTSKDQSINFPPPSELISDSDDSDSYIFSTSNRITAIKKIAYDKSDTPQDQSVHSPPLNELLFDSEDNERSKLRLSDQISARRKTFGTPDTSKDQSVYFPPSNELISDSGDSVRSKLNLCNRNTARRKTFYDNSDLSKDQSDSTPSSNELFYDDASNRSELSIRKRIPIETSPLHLSYTYYPELQTKSKENITLSSSVTDSCNNSSDNSELIKKNLEDVTNKSLTKSIRRSQHSDQFKGFDEANNSYTLKNLHMKRSLNLFSESSFCDDYGDNNIRRNSEEYVARVQRDISIKSMEGASVIPTVMVSENTKSQDNGNSFASELNKTNLTLTMQNVLASGNITDRKTRSERGQELRQTQKSPTEFEADSSGSFVQELQERLHFSDPILFESEEEIIEDEQIETSFCNQIGGPFQNCSSTSSSNFENPECNYELHHSSPTADSFQGQQGRKSLLDSPDLQDLECKNVFNHLSLNEDSFQSLQARESNLNSLNFENPECKYELNHLSPTADSFQGQQGRKSMLDSPDLQDLECKNVFNHLSLNEDSFQSLQARESNLNSPNFENPECNYELHHSSPTADSFQGQQERKSLLDSPYLEDLDCKKVFNHLSLNEDSFQSLQARESNLNSLYFENPECMYELNHSSPTADSFQGQQGRKSMLDSPDLQDLECKNVFNHLSLNEDSFQSLQARESNLNSLNFENPECMYELNHSSPTADSFQGQQGRKSMLDSPNFENLEIKYELHHSSPTANSFQGLQGRKSMLESHSFKGWVVCEPDINKVILKEDTSFSSEVCESEVYNYNNEVAFRCILDRCYQNTLVNFNDAFSVAELMNSKKIGEGVYGEVFLVKRFSDPEDSVIKIIPVQGDYVVNGEVQKTYSEIISELIISQELDSLRDSDDFFTDNFCKVKKLWCLQGKYPDRLQELWNKYNKLVGSENDSPTMFSSNQQYIVLELGHGGQALADYKFSSARQAFSIFLQTSFALAVGEQCFEFEHRDLHWGNVLVMKTTDKYAMFTIESETYKVPTYGVKATIIDYTLSRMFYAGTVNFNDLSVDPDMFKGTGDYQFDIYRIMQQLLCNDWSRYVPKTNIKWLDYIVDKLLKRALYTNPKSKIHLKFIKILENLRTIMTDFDSVYDYVVYLGTVYYETSGPFVIYKLG